MNAYDDRQVMVTLSALSYLDIPDDHAGCVADAEAWMLAALTRALEDESLATGGVWKVVWVGITPDQANLAFVVQQPGEDKLAVAVRGTLFELSCAGLENLFEDADVGSVASFSVGGRTATVAQGSSDAFAAMSSAVFEVPALPLTGTTLLEALELLADGGAPTIYVTGHSLGGCIGTMLALYLHDAMPGSLFQVYTFAAPTAGLADFAALFDGTFGGDATTTDASWRLVNVWDIVPHAWQSLQSVVDDDWYPAPGPARDAWGIVYATLEIAAALPGDHAYVQPATNVVSLNDAAPYGQQPTRWDHDATGASVVDFGEQVFFQHSLVHAYLPLLGAPPLPVDKTVRVVAGLAPDAEDRLTIVEPGFAHRLTTPAPA